MRKEKGQMEFIIIGLVVLLIILGLMFGLPIWYVWKSGLSGEAQLKMAEQNRQIAVQEAKAKYEAAEFLNKAEVRRAEGVAAANKIIAEGLGGPSGYLRYLWIQALDHNKASIIYVPTEAGLPILEAGRLLK